MAEYQLTRDEYESLEQRERTPRPWMLRILLRALFLSIIVTLLGLVVYFRQWLFAAVLLFFIAFVVFMERRFQPKEFQRDSFKSGLVRVDVLRDQIHLTAGPNQVQFVYAELECVFEYPRCFVIHQRSGFHARIPRNRLTTEEIATLTALQHTYPTIAKKMYT